MTTAKTNISPKKDGIIYRRIYYSEPEPDVMNMIRNPKKQDNTKDALTTENILDYYIKANEGDAKRDDIMNSRKTNKFESFTDKHIDFYLDKMRVDKMKISKQSSNEIVSNDRREPSIKFIIPSYQPKTTYNDIQVVNNINITLPKRDLIAQNKSRTVSNPQRVVNESPEPINLIGNNNSNSNKIQNSFDQDIPLLVKNYCEQAYDLMNKSHYKKAFTLLKKLEEMIEKYNAIEGKLDYELFNLVCHNLAMCCYKYNSRYYR